MRCETARSLPGIVRAEMITTSPFSDRDLLVLADGDARQRRRRLALRAGGHDDELARGQIGRAGPRLRAGTAE